MRKEKLYTGCLLLMALITGSCSEEENPQSHIQAIITIHTKRHDSYPPQTSPWLKVNSPPDLLT